MRRAAAALLARGRAAAAPTTAPSHLQATAAVSTSACALQADASTPTHIADEPFCRQRSLVPLGPRVPTLSPDAWVAPNAVVVGDVDLYDQV